MKKIFEQQGPDVFDETDEVYIQNEDGTLIKIEIPDDEDGDE